MSFPHLHPLGWNTPYRFFARQFELFPLSAAQLSEPDEQQRRELQRKGVEA